jgi:hypothetical protein
MELYCIGSGLILTLKNANVRKRSCGGVKRIYLKRLPLTDLLGVGLIRPLHRKEPLRNETGDVLIL